MRYSPRATRCSRSARSPRSRVCVYELAREERATVSVALQLWMDLVGGEVCHSKCAHGKGY